MYPKEYDATNVKAWAGSSQWRALRADLARFKKWGYSGWGSEGFWALCIYRAQRGTRDARPKLLWKPLRLFLAIVKKLFTMITHINLEQDAEIGPGLLIPHVGPIRVHGEAKIGADCAIHHVVTIGADSRPGAATIGDHVLLGAHCCVLGPVHIGEGATIACASLVVSDVPAHATAIGVPARVMPGRWREEAAAAPAPESVPERTSLVPGRSSLVPERNSLLPELPALVSAPAVVPPSTITAYAKVLEHARLRGDAPALSTFEGPFRYRVWTWAEYARKAQGAMGLLHGLLEPEAPVILFSRRTPECVALMLGAIGGARAFSCLNPRWRWPQIQRVLAATSSKVLFVDREGAAAVEKSSTDSERAGIRIVRIDELDLDAASIPSTLDAMRQASPERVGCYLFTSGSTGEPKGVCISEQDLFWRAETEVQWYELTQQDILLNILPFSFDVGLNQILSAAYAGCETVLCETWLPTDLLAAARDRKVTGIPCVPSIWQDFINHNLTFDTRGAHARLRFLTISGGDLPPRHLEQIVEVAPGVRIFKTYGQTEAFRAASLRPEFFASGKKTVGGPFPGVTVCIVRPDGTIANRNEVGELVHAGLGVMLGYLNDEERTRAKLRKAPFDASQIANFSGDNAFIDAEGNIHLAGRSDQMVKIMGNRVYPNEVRNLLCELEGVADAVVLADKNPQGDTQLVAFVVCRNNVDDNTLLRDMRNRLPGYMVPHHVRRVAELLRTANGKLDGEALRAEARTVARSTQNDRPAPAAPLHSALKGRIDQLVRERVDRSFAPESQRLIDVLDSVSFIDVVAIVDSEFRLGVDMSRLGTTSLESSASLAEAMLKGHQGQIEA